MITGKTRNLPLKKFTIVVTMRQDRTGITKEIKAVNNREEKLAMFVCNKEKPKLFLCLILSRK